MTHFTTRELEYLRGERRLARLATVSRHGIPHVVPVGWAYSAADGSIDISGHDLQTTKKFRDITETGLAAIVIDDVLPPWRPRGIEVRGRAAALSGPRPLIRIFPERIVSWGIESETLGKRHSRTVSPRRS